MSAAPDNAGELQIVGRSSSHYTRVVLLYAELLGLPWRLVPVADLRDTNPTAYGGHPALKIPALLQDGAALFGTQNICRVLAARPKGSVRCIWPEEAASILSMNAQELVWHCMAAQVQLVMGTVLCTLPADNTYFVKIRAGMNGSLAWLDKHVDELLPEQHAPGAISLLEVTLFCLVEHLGFRRTVPVASYQRLHAMAKRFASVDAAKRTVYRFDPV